tara:strand:+ start:989 stop:1273 length:285 start_codon:yes stop_codon:yes gene_type:complete
MEKKATTKKKVTSKKKSTIKVGGETVDTSKGVAAGVKKAIKKKATKSVSADPKANVGQPKEQVSIITHVAQQPSKSMRSANAYIERQKAKRNKK